MEKSHPGWSTIARDGAPEACRSLNLSKKCGELIGVCGYQRSVPMI